MLQFGLAEGIEEIRLVFTGVISFEQRESAQASINLSIVAGCNVLGAESIGVVQKLSKFYFSIAQNVGVWCASSLLLLKKDFENPFPVFV